MSNIIHVAWMYPDLLNLHGERGNAKALEIVSKKMGVKLKIDRIDDLEATVDFDKYDILLFNAGELKTIETISETLKRQKKQLLKYIKDNKVILVTGTTGALFADKIHRKHSSFEGLNILNMDIQEKDMVIGDDLYYRIGNMEIMASQIQMVNIQLKKAKPLGNIFYGYGNCGMDSEGARYKNVVFTNALGPALVKNPWFTEYLIKLSCKNKGIKIGRKRVNYDLEYKSLESAKEFIDKKVGQK